MRLYHAVLLAATWIVKSSAVDLPGGIFTKGAMTDEKLVLLGCTECTVVRRFYNAAMKQSDMCDCAGPWLWAGAYFTNYYMVGTFGDKDKMCHGTLQGQPGKYFSSGPAVFLITTTTSMQSTILHWAFVPEKINDQLPKNPYVNNQVENNKVEKRVWNCPAVVPTQPETKTPTDIPTPSPTYAPPVSPMRAPTPFPMKAPTPSPIKTPPMEAPSIGTTVPTLSPTYAPTPSPMIAPTPSPIKAPSKSITDPTLSPTYAPSRSLPTIRPPSYPLKTRRPTRPRPTRRPTRRPTHLATRRPTSDICPAGEKYIYSRKEGGYACVDVTCPDFTWYFYDERLDQYFCVSWPDENGLCPPPTYKANTEFGGTCLQCPLHYMPYQDRSRGCLKMP
jgi:hypothetical protein